MRRRRARRNRKPYQLERKRTGQIWRLTGTVASVESGSLFFVGSRGFRLSASNGWSRSPRHRDDGRFAPERPEGDESGRHRPFHGANRSYRRRVTGAVRARARAYDHANATASSSPNTISPTTTPVDGGEGSTTEATRLSVRDLRHRLRHSQRLEPTPHDVERVPAPRIRLADRAETQVICPHYGADFFPASGTLRVGQRRTGRFSVGLHANWCRYSIDSPARSGRVRDVAQRPGGYRGSVW
jgi:hypothetical protein